MRLVDISLGGISGQASDIKGNLNTVGHLMMLGVDDQFLPYVSGYFEIKGDVVVNAKQNYPALFKLLRASVVDVDTIADIEGDNIRLGAYPSLLETKGTGSSLVGQRLITPFVVGVGSQVVANYVVRLFIYHGVHV